MPGNSTCGRWRPAFEEKLAELPEEEQERDDRYLGEFEEKAALKSDRELLSDEINVLKKLLAKPVKAEKKIDRLYELLEQVDKETPSAKVLIFTEYRRTQEFLKEQLESWYGAGSVVLINGDMPLEGGAPVEAASRRHGEINSPLREADSKRRSQRLFRDEPSVRFLVSTEAGGEGINLQWCHIVVNYDLPWNPMRYEQRIGRVYRYGQDKVVQIYNLRAKETIEDTVRSYFDKRLWAAAEALSKVTGESVEELVGSLNGQLEAEIEPEDIYKKALVEGTLNKQTKEEIQEAVRRAQKAYEIATQSLFKDVSSYSFDTFQKALASPVSLRDLEDFTVKFLARERRQVQRKDGFYEFLTPDSLSDESLPERYKAVTFDRATAIRNSQAEFLALGHPFVNAMFRRVGDYSFGGHTAIRVIQANAPDLASPKAGYQFNFTVRSRVQRDDGDEHLFDLHTFVVLAGGVTDEKMAEVAAREFSLQDGPDDAALQALHQLESLDLDSAYRLAKAALEKRAQFWDWDEDADVIGIAKLVLVPPRN
jgi:superfamily II DNA/RNA helicase